MIEERPLRRYVRQPGRVEAPTTGEPVEARQVPAARKRVTGTLSRSDGTGGRRVGLALKVERSAHRLLPGAIRVARQARRRDH